MTVAAKVRMAMAGVMTAVTELMNGYPVLTVNLHDADLNIDSAVRETASVTVTSPRYAAKHVRDLQVVCFHVASQHRQRSARNCLSYSHSDKPQVCCKTFSVTSK